MIPNPSSNTRPAERRAALYVDAENIFFQIANAVAGPADDSSNTTILAILDRLTGITGSYGEIARLILVGWPRTLASVRPEASNRGFEFLDLPYVGKNGADIRLAAQAIYDLTTVPNLTELVVASSDSDFTGLAIAAHELGCRVIGIGSPENSGKNWRRSCDAFHDLVDLLPPSAPTQPSTALALAHVIWSAIAGTPGRTVLLSAVRPLAAECGTLLRNEEMGCSSLKRFLLKHPDLFVVEKYSPSIQRITLTETGARAINPGKLFSEYRHTIAKAVYNGYIRTGQALPVFALPEILKWMGPVGAHARIMFANCNQHEFYRDVGDLVISQHSSSSKPRLYLTGAGRDLIGAPTGNIPTAHQRNA